MEGPKAPKKRRLGDKSLPNSLTNNPSFAADSKMYTDLLEMERKLDWQMMRKKAEIQDTLGRPPSAVRTVRLFLSHTVANQPWQTGAPSVFDGNNVNLETGEGIPAWQLKIEGRLLELPNQRAKDRPVAKKFSSFVKKIFIELVRDHTLYPEGNTAELHPVTSGHELDGYTLRRTGDTLTHLKILIQLEQTPEIHKVVEPLASILGVNHETRTGLVQALWSYVKINQLQDKIDRRMVRADDALRPIFGNEAIPFQQLGEICLRFIAPADPIVLNYTIDPSQAPTEKPQAWDIEVRMEDVAARSKMNAVIVNMSPEGSAELSKLDEEIMQYAQSIQNAQTKLTFLRSFAADPAGFIDTWLASQSRDLDALLGGSEAAVIGPGGHGGLAEDTGNVRRVRAEELKRSEFFRLPWVEEAIALQEGMRLARMAQ